MESKMYGIWKEILRNIIISHSSFLLHFLDTQGRGGKGVIIVSAVGDGGVTFDDCNYDELISSRYVISVAPVDR